LRRSGVAESIPIPPVISPVPVSPIGTPVVPISRRPPIIPGSIISRAIIGTRIVSGAIKVRSRDRDRDREGKGKTRLRFADRKKSPDEYHNENKEELSHKCFR
jgi:hypothetical protein